MCCHSFPASKQQVRCHGQTGSSPPGIRMEMCHCYGGFPPNRRLFDGSNQHVVEAVCDGQPAATNGSGPPNRRGAQPSVLGNEYAREETARMVRLWVPVTRRALLRAAFVPAILGVVVTTAAAVTLDYGSPYFWLTDGPEASARIDGARLEGRQVPVGMVSSAGPWFETKVSAGTIAGAVVPSFESLLSLGATSFLKAVRRGIRQSIRLLISALRQWAAWITGSLAFLVVALLAPVFDWRLTRTLKQQGFAALSASMMRAIAVYVRLLIDRRVPTLGKSLIVLAIAYGVLGNDLIPDRIAPVGLMDDLIAIAVASRCFLHMCPNRLVEEHARNVARVNRRRRLGGVLHGPGGAKQAEAESTAEKP